MALTQFMTLGRHIMEEQSQYEGATGELSKLLHDLSLAAKIISLEVNKAGLVDIIGYTGDNNVHGEQVKKLDMLALDTLIKAMDPGGHLCVMASQVEEDIIQISQRFNIDVNSMVLFDDWSHVINHCSIRDEVSM